MQKRFSILILFVLLLQACGGSAPEPVDTSRVKLTVQVLPFLSYAPFYIAEAEGFFEEQNLDVEFIRTARSVDGVPMVISGDLDVYASANNIAYLNAVASGENIRVVADRGYIDPDGCTYLGLVARNEILSSGRLEGGPEEMNGVRIVRSPASVGALMIDVAFEERGFSHEDAVILDLNTPSRLDAFQEGTLDIGNYSEPWITRSIQTGSADIWVGAEEILPGYQLGTMAFGPNLLEDNPDAGKRFMVAYLKGVQQFNEGKTDRNVEIIAAATELEEQLVRDACWPAYRSDGHAPFEGLVPFQDWAVSLDLLDVPITEDQYFDSTFIDYANAVLDQ